RKARARQCHDGRDHGPLLAFRGRGVDRDFHGGLPDPMSGEPGGTAMNEGGSVERSVHPTADVYLRVGAGLVLLTVLAVGGFDVPAFRAVLVPVLLVLSATSVALVVMV